MQHRPATPAAAKAAGAACAAALSSRVWLRVKMRGEKKALVSFARQRVALGAAERVRVARKAGAEAGVQAMA
eukprot:1148117-Pelagomonas_calceolata.AAC.1